jgi:hypothetical protein
MDRFTELVATMRSAQKKYFAKREQAMLDECKRAEREVDREIEKRYSKLQPGLFDEGEMLGGELGGGS